MLTEVWQILAKISGPRTQLCGLWGGRGGVREHALNAGQLEREGAGTREEGQPHSPDTGLSVREKVEGCGTRQTLEGSFSAVSKPNRRANRIRQTPKVRHATPIMKIIYYSNVYEDWIEMEIFRGIATIIGIF